MTLKKIRGCLSERSPYYLPEIGIDEPLTWCPRKYADQDVYLWLAAFREYKNGFLPCAGGWGDQPLKFVEIMRIIESTVDKLGEKGNV